MNENIILPSKHKSFSVSAYNNIQHRAIRGNKRQLSLHRMKENELSVLNKLQNNKKKLLSNNEKMIK